MRYSPGSLVEFYEHWYHARIDNETTLRDCLTKALFGSTPRPATYLVSIHSSLGNPWDTH